MLSKPDRKMVEAIAHIARSANGEVLQKFLLTELQETLDMLLSAVDINVARLQGRAKLLQELTDLWREAPKIVDKWNA